MLLKQKYFVKGAKFLWYRPLFWLLYSGAVVLVFKELQVKLAIPIAIPSIIGTAIALFLGFRTNSAYQRWWEARKVWGEIINNSRTLARQILHFGKPDVGLATRHRIMQRQIAWCWALARTLRNQKWDDEASKYLEPDEHQKLLSTDHVPNELLNTQQKDLRKLVDDEGFDDFYFRKADSTLKELCDSMGKCERIQKTVFPTQYALFTLIFLNIFLLLLPLAIVETLGYFTIPLQFIIGFTFAMIQNIAIAMQDPFENKANDIPMSSISRGIERNLLEMMGEKNLPEPYPANDGILM